MNEQDKTSVSCNELLPPETVAAESASPERRNSPVPPVPAVALKRIIEFMIEEARRERKLVVSGTHRKYNLGFYDGEEFALGKLLATLFPGTGGNDQALRRGGNDL